MRSAAAADDVLVLEIGGERNTMTQVLETLLVAEPGRGLTEVPLARTALLSSAGVPIVATAFEQPLPATLAPRFREEAGMSLLVARSLLWDVRERRHDVEWPGRHGAARNPRGLARR